jgi:hypothetical protein
MLRWSPLTTSLSLSSQNQNMSISVLLAFPIYFEALFFVKLVVFLDLLKHVRAHGRPNDKGRHEFGQADGWAEQSTKYHTVSMR